MNFGIESRGLSRKERYDFQPVNMVAGLNQNAILFLRIMNFQERIMLRLVPRSSRKGPEKGRKEAKMGLRNGSMTGLGETVSDGQNPGLYIHVPFCRTKCPYCDFYSITNRYLIPAWLAGLDKEAALYKDRFGTFDSLYLGGGTPTLLDGRDLSALLDCLFRHFSFAADTEVTIEANPDDLTPEKAALLRGLGINRISVGVQSFDDQELSYLKRRHTAEQTKKALELVRLAEFTNLGLDLMYGFEGQTEDDWVSTLRRALEFRPEHLSCYQMTLEESTPFGKMKEEGRISPLGEERERTFFVVTSRLLEENGYLQYEVSNFARGEEFCCRHNQKYWRHLPYLGLGPSAHSFQDGIRWWNFKSVCRYCQALEEEEAPVGGAEILTAEQLRLESVYLGFRTRDGVDIENFHHSPRWEKILSQLQISGRIEILNNRAIPTREGYAVADRLPLLFFD